MSVCFLRARGLFGKDVNTTNEFVFVLKVGNNRLLFARLGTV